MIICLAVLQCVVAVMSMRGPHHPRGHYHYQPKGNKKLTQDTEALQDVEHIKEDLMNVNPEVDTSKMTPEELEFHYFKLHDFDNNTKLDGLEILHAIHHSTHHDHDDSEENHGDNRHKSSDLKDRVAPDKYHN
ncbi:multiple coagulation factor deficiency protein 2 homolog, partial [Nilaparvata lugens]|uniref:multiple coagulation factor deficiency protein 2 homolog n=1 Tax=Nilaparvata lugens TaxID=108931 RepID=UPI00193CC76E